MLYECLCFNLFVVCQNEDLKHVAGIVTRKREEKKKLTKNDSLCICVMGGRCVYLGGFQGVKKDKKVAKPQDYIGSISFIGSASKWNQENSYAPLNTP